MIEEEAKKKWCPFASSRVLEYHENDNGYMRIMQKSVRGDDNEPTMNCIGRKCAIWIHEGGEGSSSHGYCGLINQVTRTIHQ